MLAKNPIKLLKHILLYLTTIMKQYGLTLTIAIISDICNLNSKTVIIYHQYSHGENGLVDYVHNYYGYQGYAQMFEYNCNILVVSMLFLMPLY